ncbi:alpha/beta fold hydrolase [Nocardioides sp. TF02-7]|uniref:alpha/beta fold hydrolase n=1 Tax=Nocardioides sp. TF02-7 TaxID=2917724 RepID=UPI001F05E1DF|nr:alpha/beta fold hydrolase [Nocardioides sp. TF02-7]UMG92814.1 alpha/beta fold hydrolase [Nocardioides sp. TF02-7]
MIPLLAERYTVIAPDLLGHGLSDKPRADYTLGGYANGMRDLLTILGIDKATVVGHSFGGGIAMQFAYQFPERTERVALVASGGLGPEVTPLIRLIQAPGWEAAMSVLTLPGIRHAETGVLRALARHGGGPARRYTRDLDEVACILDSWSDRRTRFAIRHLVRAVIDWRGQIVTMSDRAYLSQAMPMAVVWGRDDQVIPAHHAENAAALAPDAMVEVMADAGHFPHRDHPEAFAAFLDRFISSTAPASYSRARFRRLLREGEQGDERRLRSLEGLEDTAASAGPATGA